MQDDRYETAGEARPYPPSLGPWARPDPLGFVDGLNAYQYVRSSPVGLSDPHGLETREERQALIQAYRDAWATQREQMGIYMQGEVLRLISELQTAPLETGPTQPIKPTYGRSEDWKPGDKVTIVAGYDTGPEMFLWDNLTYGAGDVYEVKTDQNPDGSPTSDPNKYLADLLEAYPDGSIKELNLTGHGSGVGIMTTHAHTGHPFGISNHDMSDEAAARIARKLSKDAVVTIYGCDQARYPSHKTGMQQFANRLQATVKAYTSEISWVFGDEELGAKWITMRPTTANPNIVAARENPPETKK